VAEEYCNFLLCYLLLSSETENPLPDDAYDTQMYVWITKYKKIDFMSACLSISLIFIPVYI